MRKIEELKILVVGDIMLDHYIEGSVNRISPEAPVPVVDVTKEYFRLGGCGNVVSNLRSIGVYTDCISAIGHDQNGRKIIELLKQIGSREIISRNSDMITTTKTRIISNDRHIQMLRYDSETIKYISPPTDMIINEYDVIIVSDYAKGLITQKLMDVLRRTNTKIIIDPKPKNMSLYKGIYAITPNEKEFEEARDELNSLAINGEVKNIVNTLGKDGIKVTQVNDYELTAHHIKAKPVDVYNVSGAGDTVVAVLSTCVAMGYNILDSAQVANVCAGWAVTQPGTTAISKQIFENAIRSI